MKTAKNKVNETKSYFVTAEERKRIRSDYKKGMSLADIAHKYGRTEVTIKRALDKNYKNKLEISKKEIDTFLQLKSEGKTVTEIENITGRNKTTILKYIRSANTEKCERNTQSKKKTKQATVSRINKKHISSRAGKSDIEHLQKALDRANTESMPVTASFEIEYSTNEYLKSLARLLDRDVNYALNLTLKNGMRNLQQNLRQLADS